MVHLSLEAVLKNANAAWNNNIPGKEYFATHTHFILAWVERAYKAAWNDLPAHKKSH